MKRSPNTTLNCFTKISYTNPATIVDYKHPHTADSFTHVNPMHCGNYYKSCHGTSKNCVQGYKSTALTRGSHVNNNSSLRNTFTKN